MKLIRICLLLFVFTSVGVYAQQDTARLTLLGPGGGSVKSKDGNYSFDFSMGELFVTTAKNYNQVLTQGFQQSKMLKLVGVEKLEDLNWKVELYPNPVSEFLNITFDQVPNTTFEVQFYSVAGQSVVLPLENLGTDKENKYSIDFRSAAAGSYIVKVWNKQSEKYVSTMTVVKSESIK